MENFAGLFKKMVDELYSSDINFDGVQIPFFLYQKKNIYII